MARTVKPGKNAPRAVIVTWFKAHWQQSYWGVISSPGEPTLVMDCDRCADRKNTYPCDRCNRWDTIVARHRKEDPRNRPAGFDDRDEVTFPMTGYKLVPVEPTEVMMRAALEDYLDYERQGQKKATWNGRTMWRAMLAAAGGIVFQHTDVEAIRQDAFELGVKSAGGSIIPDRSKFVELALTREQIDILAAFADNVVDDPADRNHDSAPCLRAFLEAVSIHRSRK